MTTTAIPNTLFTTQRLLGLGGALWIALLWLQPQSWALITDYLHFILLGITGAIFANSTGAGGGVIFIPAFNQLGFSESQAIATSFAIQCCGMTAGALTWLKYYRRDVSHQPQWQPFFPIIALSALCSIIGLWTVYGMGIDAPAALHPLFSGFSIVLGLAILIMALGLPQGTPTSHLTRMDVILLMAITVFGGGLTAWLSVGVGELMALYLIIRRFDVTLAIATAVIVSMLTVWAGAIKHVWLDNQVYWAVVLFAGPGAVIGGILAKQLVARLPAKQLKLFFGSWVLLSGLAG